MPKDEEKTKDPNEEGLTKKARELRKRRGKHSIAGTEYLRYGDKGFEELSKSRQRTARLKKEVAAMDSKVPKPISVGKLSSAGSSTPLSFVEWTKKYGYGKTPATLKMHRAYVKNFGKAK